MLRKVHTLLSLVPPYTTTKDVQPLSQQLQEILDERLWVNRHPGDPETLSAHEFLRWLETWNEIRSGFAAQKLCELGETFSVLCLSHLVTVVSTDIPYARFLGRDFTSEDFGEFVVRARRPEHWDPIIETLGALWDVDPEFLLNILRQCCYEHGILAIAGEDDRKQMFHDDAAGERERDREQRGFVTPLSASIFLSEAKSAELEELLAANEYDLNTARYFDLSNRGATVNAHIDAPESAQDIDEPNVADSNTPSEDERARLAELEEALIDAEIVQSQSTTPLLTGPDAGPEETLVLTGALNALQANQPEAFAERLSELGYLSNTLMSGCEYRGRRFEEAESANATIAICNLGLGYLRFASDPEAAEDAFFSDQLARAPGLVRAFQIGWNLTYKLPLRTIARLFETLYAPEMQRKLTGHPWLNEQVGAALPQLRLAYISGDGARETVREVINMLGLVFDHSVCQCLTSSVDTLPCFPRSLDADATPTIKVNTATRFISSMEDLRAFDVFLASLPDRTSI